MDKNINWKGIHNKYYHSQLTLNDIAKELKCTRCLVSYYFKKLQLPIKTINYKINWKEQHKEYLNGKSRKKLAKELNCSESCVYNNFRKFGLKIRTPEEFGILNRGGNHSSFKAHKYIAKDGRVYIRVNGKQTLEARYIWEQYYNKKIPKGFLIHHIDYNRQNNVIKNLKIMSISEHVGLHNKQYKRNLGFRDDKDEPDDLSKTKVRQGEVN